LSKNNTKLNIKTFLPSEDGCGSTDEVVNLGEVDRYSYKNIQVPQPNKFTYSPKNGCFFVLQSNISSDEYPQTKLFATQGNTLPYKDSKNVVFFSIIEASGVTDVSEIDQIISQSSFK
jgi:hypothetical protein